jgi:hypothetical protein
MDFQLSVAEEAFRDKLRTWLEAHCPRGWDEMRQRLGSPAARARFLIDWQRTFTRPATSACTGPGSMAAAAPP